MNIKEANESFEKWRKEQIASLVRTGHVEAAKAFEQLGSIHWMAWQSAWQASRAAIEVELPAPNNDYTYSDREISGACEHYRRAKKAIDSIGLKVKP